MFKGSIVALVTPMFHTGEIDYPSLNQLIEFHCQQGTDGIVVAGSTGESATLTDHEKSTLIQYVVKHASGRVPVIAGTGSAATSHAVKLTQMAMDLGVDACLLMTPPYVKPTQEGLYQHFRYIANQVAVPQILYNVPGRTACDLLPETVERLTSFPNIVGIKEATGKIERTQQILNRCGDSLDLFSGDDPTALGLIKVGAKGVISVTANIVPRLMHEMVTAMLEGDEQLADNIDQRLQPLHQQLFIESNPIPTKWALQHMQLIGSGIRLPLTPLRPENQTTLANLLKQFVYT